MLKSFLQKLFGIYFGIFSILCALGFGIISLTLPIKEFINLSSGSSNLFMILGASIFEIIFAIICFGWIPGLYKGMKKIMTDKKVYKSVLKGLIIFIAFINIVLIIILLLEYRYDTFPFKDLIFGNLITLPIYPFVGTIFMARIKSY